MKKIMCIIFLMMFCLHGKNPQSMVNEKKIQLTIKNQQQEKMKLAIGVLNPTDTLLTIAEIIQHNLSCYQQQLSGFNVILQTFAEVPSKKQLKKFFGDGYNIIIFLSLTKDNKIEWRIYDTLQGVMQKGKRLPQQKTAEITAQILSDQLWLLLTGQESIFLTKIAYCKTINKGKQTFKNIYIQGPNESKTKCIVKGGKPLAPRWNTDKKFPLILYSEFTPVNVRLMSTTLQGQRKIVSNFDGLTMLASFSLDGQRVVYCASYKGNSQLYYYYFDQAAKKGITKRLTHNQGNNTSPNLCDNGDVIFCSDFETKSPQLYYLHAQTGQIERLTFGGYCASPHFSEKKGAVAYSKLVGNDMQIFLYNLATKEHKQITFDKGSKDECSWSPCGNYLTFVKQEGVKSRIAVLNMITQESFFLTSEMDICSYPSWSPNYTDFSLFA